MTLHFRVYGVPAPQGSKRWVGGHAIESSRKVGPWRDAVIEAVRSGSSYNNEPLDGPLTVTVKFVMPRPGSAKKDAKWQIRTPDLDKLLRSTFDAFKIAGLIVDDARICSLQSWKVLAEKNDPWTGAEIWIGGLEP